MSQAQLQIVDDRYTQPPAVEQSRSEFSAKPFQFSWAEIGIVLGLMLFGFLISLLGAIDLEFFRHTEADRTLIAWEMLKRGEFFVPHLLGSIILTKPPLFYWLVASSIYLAGEPLEWVARMPSVITASLFIGMQYYFWRFLGARRGIASLAAIVCCMTPIFFRLSAVAEIDMVFGFLTALALYCGYCSLQRRSWQWMLGAYLVTSLAFLAKGPPVLLFFGVSIVAFYIWMRAQRPAQTERTVALPVSRFVPWNLAGAFAFIAVIACWLSLVASEVGWAALGREFQVEILDRIVDPSRHHRGIFFYPISVIGGLLPWSLLCLLGFIAPFFESTKTTYAAIKQDSKYWSFLVFNAIALVAAIVMLSLAEGKSSRYFFPVYICAVNLCICGMLQLRDTRVERMVFKVAGYILLATAGVLGGALWFLTLEGVPRENILITGGLLLSSCLFLSIVSFKQKRLLAVVALVSVLGFVRVGQALVYTPHRNAERSVKRLAATLASEIPAEQPVYTLELFERWIVYYLIRDGRTVFRLTPERMQELVKQGGSSLMLFSGKEELWRIAQLRRYTRSLRIVQQVANADENVLLVEIPNRVLPVLEPKHRFPTKPTKAK